MVSKFKVTKPLLKKITKWASNGLNKGDIGILLGYTKDHFYQMMKNSDEMTKAYSEGRVGMKSLLESTILSKAISSDKDSLQAGTYLLNRHFANADDGTNEITDTGVTDADIKNEILDDLR